MIARELDYHPVQKRAAPRSPITPAKPRAFMEDPRTAALVVLAGDVPVLVPVPVLEDVPVVAPVVVAPPVGAALSKRG